MGIQSPIRTLTPTNYLDFRVEPGETCRKFWQTQSFKKRISVCVCVWQTLSAHRHCQTQQTLSAHMRAESESAEWRCSRTIEFGGCSCCQVVLETRLVWLG